ncbi:MAG: energy transducer TonB [Novosphingobium sp.]
MIAAAGTVLAILAGMTTITIVGKHQERRHLTVMHLRELDTRPKAALPPERPEKSVEAPVPAFVPRPEIQLPAPGPVKVALDTPPPAQPVRIAAPQPVKAEAAASEPASSAAAQNGGDLAGQALFIKPPVYPLEARRRHEQGVVKLLVLVGPDGRVDDIEIADSSGSKALDRAALRAVRHWRWKPAAHGGTAVAIRGYVTIPFVLQPKDA